MSRHFGLSMYIEGIHHVIEHMYIIKLIMTVTEQPEMRYAWNSLVSWNMCVLSDYSPHATAWCSPDCVLGILVEYHFRPQNMGVREKSG